MHLQGTAAFPVKAAPSWTTDRATHSSSWNSTAIVQSFPIFQTCPVLT